MRSKSHSGASKIWRFDLGHENWQKFCLCLFSKHHHDHQECKAAKHLECHQCSVQFTLTLHTNIHNWAKPLFNFQFYKVKIFWEGQNLIWNYLLVSKNVWRFRLILWLSLKTFSSNILEFSILLKFKSLKVAIEILGLQEIKWHFKMALTPTVDWISSATLISSIIM